MKPLFEYLPRAEDESFVVKEFEFNYFPTPWHYHRELELALIAEGTGQRFIGDGVGRFTHGEVVLFGVNLPHTYRCDPVYYRKGSKRRVRSVVVHFLEDMAGLNFLAMPEAEKVVALFKRAERGLLFKGKTKEAVSAALHNLVAAEGMARVILLLEILNGLAHSTECEFLSAGALQGVNEMDSLRMNTIINYVLKNFRNEIRLSQVAALLHMTENSFSRYFSKHTKKPFITYVNEVRLSEACKLLIENKRSVGDICYETGFNNLSHFNSSFKKVYAMNPLQYRKRFMKGALGG